MNNLSGSIGGSCCYYGNDHDNFTKSNLRKMMKQQMVLTVRNKSEILYLRLDDILYIQADGNYCNIYLIDGGVINTLTYQRAEIARMMDEQVTEDFRRRFVLVGRYYMVNTDYVLRIQPSKQLLTFRVNRFGTTKKITIKVSSKALDVLAKDMDKQTGRNADS